MSDTFSRTCGPSISGVEIRGTHEYEAISGIVAGAGTAPPAGRRSAASWSATGGGGAAGRCLAPVGAAVGATARAGWHSRSAARWSGWKSAGADGWATRSAGEAVEGGLARGRVRHGDVDAAAHRSTHRARVRSAPRRQFRVANLAADGLECATAGEPRSPAGSGGRDAVEAEAVASAKKSAARQGRVIVFIDESGLSERPCRARTWSPRGQTPILQYSFTWKQLSVIAGVSFWRFYFQLFPGAIKSPQIVEFLKALQPHIGRTLLLLCDHP